MNHSWVIDEFVGHRSDTHINDYYPIDMSYSARKPTFQDVIIIIIICLIIHISCQLIIIKTLLDNLWNKATPARRLERVVPYVVIGDKYYSTGLSISRAYTPFFELIKMGIIRVLFSAVVVNVTCVIDGIRYTAVGTRSESRRNTWVYDVGACGGISTGETTHEAAKKELKEELNLETPVVYRKTIVDEHIIHVFDTVVPLDTNGQLPKLTSPDGTYEKIEWAVADFDSIIEYMVDDITNKLHLGINANRLSMLRRDRV